MKKTSGKWLRFLCRGCSTLVLVWMLGSVFFYGLFELGGAPRADVLLHVLSQLIVVYVLSAVFASVIVFFLVLLGKRSFSFFWAYVFLIPWVFVGYFFLALHFMYNH